MTDQVPERSAGRTRAVPEVGGAEGNAVPPAAQRETNGHDPAGFEILALDGIPEVRPGDDLAALILAAYGALGPLDGDILVVTSKVVSKAEGRLIPGDDREAAIDAETVREVARVDWNGGSTRIVESRQGLILAAAGVDASNVDDGYVLLLPVDPDASALALATAIRAATGVRVGVVVSDTLGRAWRIGQTDHAIGAAGVLVADDLRGSTDSRGRVLEATVPAIGDELAAAADLVKGKATGHPVAVVRGLGHLVRDLDAPGARTLQRPAREDLFREGAAEAWRRGYETALLSPPPVSNPAKPGTTWTLAFPASGETLDLSSRPRAMDAFRLVIPVKPAAVAKSRLADAVPPELREGLARAIALDTIEAASRSGWVSRVLVVTSDAVTATEAVAIPHVEVVPDTADGLRSAIVLGLEAAGEDQWRAVLLGDLPALAPEELGHAFQLGMTAARAFVRDADQTGTVLATARPGMPLEPLFGEDSAALHLAAGFAELSLPAHWGLRRDVDTVAHLDALVEAGRLGPRTRAVLDAAR